MRFMEDNVQRGIPPDEMPSERTIRRIIRPEGKRVTIDFGLFEKRQSLKEYADWVNKQFSDADLALKVALGDAEIADPGWWYSERSGGAVYEEPAEELTFKRQSRTSIDRKKLQAIIAQDPERYDGLLETIEKTSSYPVLRVKDKRDDR